MPGIPPNLQFTPRPPETVTFYPSVIPVQDRPPASSAMVWVDTSSTPPQLKGWAGAAWVAITGDGGGGYVDPPDATTTTKGIVRLAGDLDGTAATPTVPGLAGKANAVHTHTTGQITGLDAAIAAAVAAAMGAATTAQTFSTAGPAVVAAGKHRLYNDTGGTLTIAAIRASVGTAPTGATLIVDVNRGGTTIFTNQLDRPTVTAATFTATSGPVGVTSWPAGDYLTVDVDQVGSTVAGSDLTVTVTTRGPA